MTFAHDLYATWVLAQRLERAAAEFNRRVATVHERVACPRCRSGVGERCVSMVKSVHDRELKHPHAERLRADGIALR